MMGRISAAAKLPLQLLLIYREDLGAVLYPPAFAEHAALLFI